MNFFRILSALMLLFASSAFAAKPSKGLNIVTTSSPMAAIFHMIITTGDKVDYLVEQGCPHHYQMKPSQMQLIKKADIISYINKDFDSFIVNASSQNEKAYVINFSDLKLFLITNQSGSTNWHIWLDTKNVRLMMLEIMDVVSKLRQDKKDLYLENYQKAIALLDLLDKKAATISADKQLLLADNIEYLFAQFKNEPGKILLGHKQATIEYARNLRNKANSGQFYCAIISNHQSDEYYNNMMNSKLNLVTLHPEDWVISPKDDHALIYYTNMQSMYNKLQNLCSAMELK